MNEYHLFLSIKCKLEFLIPSSNLRAHFSDYSMENWCVLEGVLTCFGGFERVFYAYQII